MVPDNYLFGLVSPMVLIDNITIHYNTVIQYNTIQYSTVQYNTIIINNNTHTHCIYSGIPQ